jgi:multidrug efflux pump
MSRSGSTSTIGTEGISAPFIRRPIATTLLTAAVALAGIVAFLQLPTAPLPQVDFPTISVSATLPGASPDIMASAVAAPWSVSSVISRV